MSYAITVPLRSAVEALDRMGFIPANVGPGGSRGFRHPGFKVRGAVYVGEDYLLPSGVFRDLFEEWAHPSASMFGHEVWRGPELDAVLANLRVHLRSGAAMDRPPVKTDATS